MGPLAPAGARPALTLIVPAAAPEDTTTGMSATSSMAGLVPTTSHTAAPAPLDTATCAVPAGAPACGGTGEKGAFSAATSWRVVAEVVTVVGTNTEAPAGTWSKTALTRVPDPARPAVSRLPRTAWPTSSGLKKPLSVLKMVPGTFCAVVTVGSVAIVRFLNAVPRASSARSAATRCVAHGASCAGAVSAADPPAVRAEKPTPDRANATVGVEAVTSGDPPKVTDATTGPTEPGGTVTALASNRMLVMRRLRVALVLGASRGTLGKVMALPDTWPWKTFGCPGEPLYGPTPALPVSGQTPLAV